MIMRDVTPFIANIMLQLRMEYVDGDVKEFVAATNGSYIRINRRIFDILDKKELAFVMIHEVMHVGLFHMIRCGNKHPMIWNLACDFKVNNYLNYEAPFSGSISMPEKKIGGIHNKKYLGMSTEEIYKLLMKDVEGTKIECKGAASNDIIPIDPEDTEAITDILSKVTTASSTGDKSDIPDEITSEISKFTEHKLNWMALLKKYLTKDMDSDYTYKSPSRRHIGRGEYFPSLSSQGGIERVLVYVDSSGSVTNEELENLYSEMLGIIRTYRVESILFKNFDTSIRQECEINSRQKINNLKVVGRGGTDLRCVREDIVTEMAAMKGKQAIVVMSDLHCSPMSNIQGLHDIIWVCVNNPQSFIPHGVLIHLEA